MRWSDAEMMHVEPGKNKQRNRKQINSIHLNIEYKYKNLSCLIIFGSFSSRCYLLMFILMSVENIGALQNVNMEMFCGFQKTPDGFFPAPSICQCLSLFSTDQQAEVED